MKLEKVINKSVYGVVGYIGKWDDINLFERYIVYNFPILKRFKQVIVAINYQEYNLMVNAEINKILNKYFQNYILINSPINRGHNFGTADLDNLIFNYCKNNNIEWLCKSSMDVVLFNNLLDLEIEEADFYYMNGIGFGGMAKYNFDFETIIKEDFYPQTNFYFINVSKTDYLNDIEYLDETYEIIRNIPNYNGKVWEYIQGWSCEDFLKNCVNRNKLSKYHLVPEKTYLSLLEYVKNNNIHDCSYKNIIISGVCHYQHNTLPVTLIE